ncbi:hypothetical protein EIP86_001897 [Pleurotus ostreatoroseus]|nr:hypothetical protein EIP86_001897 [Pleurotus ostreatoroseus]
MDRRREIFVNVPAERPQHEQSFEELRIADYIRAYSTTGHPPQPCPREPFDKAQRERLGLPPHMEPHVEVDSIPAPPSECAAAALLVLNVEASTPTGPPPTDIAALPEVQTFKRTPDASEGGREVYLQSIACQHTFQNFSPEELRVRAYSMGKVYIPGEAVGE